MQAASVYAPFFTRLEAALSGTDSPRCAVVQALVARNAATFETAFDALIAVRQAEIRADIARSQLETPQIVAERQVFIEGLALLRLADAAGMATRVAHLYCPSNARVTMRTPVPDGPAPGEVA